MIKRLKLFLGLWLLFILGLCLFVALPRPMYFSYAQIISKSPEAFLSIKNHALMERTLDELNLMHKREFIPQLWAYYMLIDKREKPDLVRKIKIKEAVHRISIKKHYNDTYNVSFRSAAPIIATAMLNRLLKRTVAEHNIQIMDKPTMARKSQYNWAWIHNTIRYGALVAFIIAFVLTPLVHVNRRLPNLR